ncbi:bifunctional ADP-dependent NAD(P)H-hydrate dehydratase/NAD(P)H-hydrate epimerase [Vulgatibacter incomptus]|uniref:Bifunctional NAD(P)H-hydrate repair enzyme n=1 Tax=Vulgatibacter incomptus TaxID=1391653 RepID=A0A0K1PDX5_9BACT|nr:bifunctional ADP-dependent NAD(P)H-hydrate dehydratase/NAD(P)H-hydrate epimerase [Vulgatibacter incomptus]AKU91626.1 NAD(P)HX epimerase / NAD(P)HX dehydratase [Vulgatibacter incomptus]
MRILTAAETQAVDRAAIDEFGVPGLLLMEHAARAVTDVVLSRLRPGGRVFVVTGPGNNGGDGYAAARLLLAEGREASVLAVFPKDRLKGDAAANAALWDRFGGRTHSFSPELLADAVEGDVVVDSLLGTGLSRPPEGLFARAIEAMNAASGRGARVVAVDLPSGLSADTGRAPGDVVRANATVTFGALKPGLVLHPGAELAGEVKVASIGWPPDALRRVSPGTRLLSEGEIRGLLPRRTAESHKGTYGHCLVVAGSEGKTGAAALAGQGALRGGAGLVSVAARPGAIPQILGHAMELMGVALDGEGPLSLRDAPALVAAARGKSALLMGPGIWRGEETGALVGRILAEAECPVVLDADALNALEGQTSLLEGAATDVVLTPHPGELARLVGTTAAEIQADRIGIARRFAQEHRCTVVLKGSGTVIAEADGEVAISPTGNAGMATAGSGDVLGGFVAALLGQGLSGPAAARAGVFVHGLAGDRRVKATGMSGLVASELLSGIVEVWSSWSL